MAQILVVDDDPVFNELTQAQIGKLGYACNGVMSLYQALSRAETGSYDVIFLDVTLPDGNGVDKIQEFTSCESSPEIIIITADGDPEAAGQAIRNGAWDYIQKPVAFDTLKLILSRVLHHRESKSKQARQQTIIREGIIGNSRPLLQCLENLAQVSRGKTNVLITGETGTGKELFATAVHLNSARADKQLIVADCTSIPETLAESLLFGHMKGSFTGANSSTLGLFMQADGGTLFLDEIGDLSLTVQKTFLRVLQERKLKPIGAKKEIASDFRLVSATNRNLEKMVATGTFRRDLYYRLTTSKIHLPPLRERRDDIPLLLDHYLTRSCTELNVPLKTYDQDFTEALLSYNWPGNVREFINAINTASAKAPAEDELCLHHLPTDIRAHLAKLKMSNLDSEAARKSAEPKTSDSVIRIVPGTDGQFPSFKDARREIVDSMEKTYLDDLLAFSSRDFTEACKISGLSRARLYELLKKHGISVKGY